MAAPAFFAAGTQTNVSSASGVTLPMPAGVVTGHFLIAVISVNAFLTDVPTAPAGWTLLRAEEEGAGSIHSDWIYTRYVPGGGLASQTFTFAAAANGGGIIFAFSGVDATIGVNAHSSIAASTSVGAFLTTASRVDVPTVNGLFVALRTISTINHQRNQTFSGDVTSRFNGGTTLANSYGYYLADKVLTATGVPAVLPTSSGNDTVTGQNAAGILYTIALREVGASGTSIFYGSQIRVSSDDGNADTSISSMGTTSLGVIAYWAGSAVLSGVARFPFIAPIPANAIIDKAVINFTNRLAATVTGVAISKMDVQRSAAPITLGTWADYVARTWNATQIDWTLTGSFVVDDRLITPDIKAAVQAVKTEFSGSALSGITVRLNSTANSSTNNIAGWTFDGGGFHKAPILEITYSTTPPPAVGAILFANRSKSRPSFQRPPSGVAGAVLLKKITGMSKSPRFQIVSSGLPVGTRQLAVARRLAFATSVSVDITPPTIVFAVRGR